MLFLLVAFSVLSGGACIGLCGIGAGIFRLMTFISVGAAWLAYKSHEPGVAIKLLIFASMWLVCAMALKAAQMDLLRRRRRTY
jgi:hypothetical protein